MTDIAAMLRAAAEVAERAAVGQQHAALNKTHRDPTIISRMELTADNLGNAATLLDPPPYASRRTVAAAVLMICVQVTTFGTALLIVPSPARPLVLAAAVAGSWVLSKLVHDLIASIRDRRESRALASATTESVDIQSVIADVRARISAITLVLEPDRNDLHLKAGQLIDSAQVWLDSADRPLTPPQ